MVFGVSFAVQVTFSSKFVGSSSPDLCMSGGGLWRCWGLCVVGQFGWFSVPQNVVLLFLGAVVHGRVFVH